MVNESTAYMHTYIHINKSGFFVQWRLIQFILSKEEAWSLSQWWISEWLCSPAGFPDQLCTFSWKCSPVRCCALQQRSPWDVKRRLWDAQPQEVEGEVTEAKNCFVRPGVTEVRTVSKITRWCGIYTRYPHLHIFFFLSPSWVGRNTKVFSASIHGGASGRGAK